MNDTSGNTTHHTLLYSIHLTTSPAAIKHSNAAFVPERAAFRALR